MSVHHSKLKQQHLEENVHCNDLYDLSDTLYFYLFANVIDSTVMQDDRTLDAVIIICLTEHGGNELIAVEGSY